MVYFITNLLKITPPDCGFFLKSIAGIPIGAILFNDITLIMEKFSRRRKTWKRI